jgi:hypothetical protein
MFDKCKGLPVMDTLWIMLSAVECDNSSKSTKLIDVTLNMNTQEAALRATLEENAHRCARKAIQCKAAVRGGTHGLETNER